MKLEVVLSLSIGRASATRRVCAIDSEDSEEALERNVAEMADVIAKTILDAFEAKAFEVGAVIYHEGEGCGGGNL